MVLTLANHQRIQHVNIRLIKTGDYLLEYFITSNTVFVRHIHKIKTKGLQIFNFGLVCEYLLLFLRANIAMGTFFMRPRRFDPSGI